MRILPLGNRGNKINGMQEPSGVALFFEVDDATLARIESNSEYFLDRELVNDCFSQTGRNAHLYLLVNGGELKEVVQNLKFLVNQYKSVSWWTVEHRKFFIRRRNV